MPAIRNDYLSVKIDLDGGKLASIIDLNDGEELLFDGDKEVWDKKDSVLFPFVGRQKNGFYLHNGDKYEMPIHGIAPYKTFFLESIDSNRVRVSLKSDSETMRIYPFPFELFVTYTLKNNTVKVEYKVVNTGEKTMYFFIGSHPALKIDETKGEEIDDTSGNWLDFHSEGNATYTLMNNYLAPKQLIDSKVELTKSLFQKYPSLVMDRKNDTVTLTRRNGKSVNVISSSPIICVWQDGKRGGLTAVESWWGLPDFWNETQRELKNKLGINSLEPSMEFKCEYKMEFIGKQEKE